MNGKISWNNSELNNNIEVIVSVNFKCSSLRFIYDENREEHPNSAQKKSDQV